MRTIPEWLSLEIWILLVGLAIIISYRMLTGGINMSGLLNDKRAGLGFSPARLQLLISTITFGGYYIAQVVSSTETKTLPSVPEEMLMLLGGSHVVYLGAKGLGLMLDTLANSISRKNP